MNGDLVFVVLMTAAMTGCICGVAWSFVNSELTTAAISAAGFAASAFAIATHIGLWA